MTPPINVDDLLGSHQELAAAPQVVSDDANAKHRDDTSPKNNPSRPSQTNGQHAALNSQHPSRQSMEDEIPLTGGLKLVSVKELLGMSSRQKLGQQPQSNQLGQVQQNHHGSQYSRMLPPKESIVLTLNADSPYWGALLMLAALFRLWLWPRI